MGMEEFLRQLEMLLGDISAEERADAMAFYRSYFEDAGPENEKAVLKELESPQKVADSIRKNLETGVAVYHGGYTGGNEAYSGGYTGSNTSGNTAYTSGNGAYTGGNGAYSKPQRTQKDHTAVIILGIIALVFTSPLWIGLAAAVFGIIIAILAVMAALLITGLVLAGTGIGEIVAVQPLIGIGLLGGGCIVLALGILVLLAVVWLFGALIPWLWRGIVTLCKKIFGRGEERAAV